MSSELSVRLRTQQVLSFIALAIIAAAGWYFMVRTEIAMRLMEGEGVFMSLMAMMMRPADAAPYLVATFLMWSVMMIAMMVPAVMPMLVVYRKLNREGVSELGVWSFAAGYLLAWVAFSAGAAALQWMLHRNGMLGGDLLALRRPYAAGILIVAGLYQWTPQKDACLERCRSPFGFFIQHFKAGASGAFGMGVSHGLFCIGCCWALMAVVFVGGVMSVLAMALLCVLIVAERLLPAGPWVSRVPGALLILVGCYLAAMG